MIFRRVVRHVKAQNWTAVALDFVIVVAGVFVGLQVQKWNAARGHRAAEIGYLGSMEEEVVFSDPLLIASFDMTAVFSKPRPDGTRQPIPWLKSVPRTSPTPAVMKSMPFRNVVLYRSFFTGARIGSVQQLLEQHRRIAELIDARQVALGLL